MTWLRIFQNPSCRLSVKQHPNGKWGVAENGRLYPRELGSRADAQAWLDGMDRGSCLGKNPLRHWHWVEDDGGVVLFVGSESAARSYYRKQGGASEGLHLMSALAEGMARPKIGEKIP